MITKVQKELLKRTTFEELDIQNVEINEITPYDIYIKQGEEYIIIVKAGTLIDDRIYSILLSQKIYIDKNAKNSAKLSCKNLEEFIQSAKDNPEYCINLLYEMNNIFFEKYFSSEDDKFSTEDVEGIVNSIIFLIGYNKSFVRDNIDKLKDDNDLAHHSLHVCIYSVSLGLALGFDHIEIQDLAIAAYLQDIGLEKVDKNIVSKNSPLSTEELSDIHKHTIISMRIIKHNRIHRPDIINGVKHHHECYDGSGYPDGLKADQISKFAAVLAICDVFDALTSNRPYRKKMSSFEALTHMMRSEEMEYKFDDKFIKVFIRTLVK